MCPTSNDQTTGFAEPHVGLLSKYPSLPVPPFFSYHLKWWIDRRKSVRAYCSCKCSNKLHILWMVTVFLVRPFTLPISTLLHSSPPTLYELSAHSGYTSSKPIMTPYRFFTRTRGCKDRPDHQEKNTAVANFSICLQLNRRPSVTYTRHNNS